MNKIFFIFLTIFPLYCTSIMAQVTCSRPFITYAEKYGLSAPLECIIPPQYSYGDLALRRYIRSRVRYPKEAKRRRISGVVKVRFLVKKDGKIGDIYILQSPSKLLSKALVSVIRHMPRWEPGKDYWGNPVDAHYNTEYWFNCDEFQTLRWKLWTKRYGNDEVYTPL